MDSELEDTIRVIFTEAGVDDSLPCPLAFELSEKHGISKMDLARYCNAHDIKIRKCQLGCFK